jgi:hypothetical protein
MFKYVIESANLWDNTEIAQDAGSRQSSIVNRVDIWADAHSASTAVRLTIDDLTIDDHRYFLARTV